MKFEIEAIDQQRGEVGKELVGKDIAEKVTVNTYNGIRTFRPMYDTATTTRLGSEVYTFLIDNVFYTFELVWDTPQANSSDNTERLEFVNLINSFKQKH